MMAGYGGYRQRQYDGGGRRRVSSDVYGGVGGGGGYVQEGLSVGGGGYPDSGYLTAPIQQSGYSQSPGHGEDLNLLHPPPHLPSIEERLGLDGLIEIDYETFILLLGVAGAAAAYFLYQAIVANGRRMGWRRWRDGGGLDALHNFIHNGEGSK